MRLFLLSYHALNLTLASRNQHEWCVTWHFTKDSSLQMFQTDMQTCFCSEYMERVVRVCITEWKYWIFFANLWLINASKISLFKTPRDWGWYCTQSLSVCVMLLQMIHTIVQRGCFVFSEVHVGFFAARRSLFRSSRAAQHREVKELLLVFY